MRTESINTTFFCINSNEPEQRWITSLLRLCFADAAILEYSTVAELSLDETSAEAVLCCNVKDLVSVGSVLQDRNVFIPILVLAGGSQKSAQLKDQQHLTFEIIPADMLSPGLLKLAVSSLLRDYKKEQQLRELAHFDPLTGTANRHLFYDRLKQAIKHSKRNNAPLSVLYFDLDKFKPVNDTYGHHIGDRLLQYFAKQVRSCLRDIDTLGRLGGDEFSAILLNASRADATATAQRIIDMLAEELIIEGCRLTIHTSIGIITYSSADKLRNLSHQKIMKAVDAVTYEAKKEGKHSYIAHEI